MSAYIESYKFSQPTKDQRQVALDEAARANGIPLHDLRAVDLVEQALLNPDYDYRTAAGIEKEVFKLPFELIAAILAETPAIARLTPYEKDGEQIYAHKTKPEDLREAAEVWRRILAR
jgi:hypothetical protein